MFDFEIPNPEISSHFCIAFCLTHFSSSPSALNVILKEKDFISLADIARETGKSRNWCGVMLRRSGYRMMLRRYTFALNETQKAQRKQMALEFEEAVFEDPDFIQVKP